MTSENAIGVTCDGILALERFIALRTYPGYQHRDHGAEGGQSGVFMGIPFVALAAEIGSAEFGADDDRGNRFDDFINCAERHDAVQRDEVRPGEM